VDVVALNPRLQVVERRLDLEAVQPAEHLQVDRRLAGPTVEPNNGRPGIKAGEQARQIQIL